MSKRASGEGSIVKRTDRDLWLVRWTENGQRRSASAKSQAQAADILQDVNQRLRAGQPGVDSTDTFRSVADRWRRTAGVSQGIGTRSLIGYSDVLRLHVHPVIGHLPIKEVKPSHVAEVMQTMAEKGHSASYQHQAHKAISNVFKMAIGDDLVIRNPTLSVKAPRGGHKEPVVPTREQVAAMIEASPDARVRALVAVLAYSGLRIGNALALRWSDYDADAGQLLVVKGGKETRTRRIPVPPSLAAELKRWRKAQAEEQMRSVWWDTDHDWILSTDVGTQWDAHNARKRFKPLADGRGPLPGRNGRPSRPALPAICPGATPHSLRHATATILLEQGVPMRVVSELLGHSSTRITEDIYSHVTPRLLGDAVAALESAIGTPGTNPGTNT